MGSLLQMRYEQQKKVNTCIAVCMRRLRNWFTNKSQNKKNYILGSENYCLLWHHLIVLPFKSKEMIDDDGIDFKILKDFRLDIYGVY